MNCQGCGTALEPEPTLDAVNRAVDDVLEASLDDAQKRGGVCPLCGHSKHVPRSHRKDVQFSLLLGCFLLLGLVLAATLYYRSPLRSSLAQDALRQAVSNAKVRAALGQPIRAGLLARGTIHQDETGWGEAKLNIPLRGPKNTATLRITAGKGSGPWIYSVLEVVVEGQPKPIDLVRGKLEVTSENAYLDVHTEPAVVPEFLNAVAPTPTWDGAYPVIRITPLIDARGQLKLSHSFATGKPSVTHDSPVNTFEVDLRSGMFVLRQTDLFVKDVMPLLLTRTYRQWDLSSHAFGMGTNHPYDICPMGTRNPYTFMDVCLEDGNPVHFDRISKGTGYADAVYEHTATSSEFYKSRFWWNGSGWTLRFADASMFLFPESYNGKSFAQGAPFEMRNATGDRIRLKRDEERNLRSLISPSGRKIDFQYDAASRITEASDDQGNRVVYSYDPAGRLLSVSDTKGHMTRFTYDRDMMVTIEDGAGHIVLGNRYTYGRISEQVLADGSLYHYRYRINDDNDVTEAFVSASNGTERAFTFDHRIPVDRKPSPPQN